MLATSVHSLRPRDVFWSYFFTSTRGTLFYPDTLEFLGKSFDMSGDYYNWEVVRVEAPYVICRPHEQNFSYYINSCSGKYENLVKPYLESDDYFVSFTTDFEKHPVLYTPKYKTLLNEWRIFMESKNVFKKYRTIS